MRQAVRRRWSPGVGPGVAEVDRGEGDVVGAGAEEFRRQRPGPLARGVERGVVGGARDGGTPRQFLDEAGDGPRRALRGQSDARGVEIGGVPQRGELGADQVEPRCGGERVERRRDRFLGSEGQVRVAGRENGRGMVTGHRSPDAVRGPLWTGRAARRGGAGKYRDGCRRGGGAQDRRRARRRPYGLRFVAGTWLPGFHQDDFGRVNILGRPRSHPPENGGWIISGRCSPM